MAADEPGLLAEQGSWRGNDQLHHSRCRASEEGDADALQEKASSSPTAWVPQEQERKELPGSPRWERGPPGGDGVAGNQGVERAWATAEGPGS